MNQQRHTSSTSHSPDEPLSPANGVNLEKATPAEDHPAAPEGTPDGTRATEKTGGRSVHSKPSEGRSKPGRDDDNVWFAFLPLGVTLILLGLTMENWIPTFTLGMTFFMVYLSSTLK